MRRALRPPSVQLIRGQQTVLPWIRHYSSPSSTGSKPHARSRTALWTVGGISTVFGAYLLWPSPSRRGIVSSSLPLSPFHFTPARVQSSESNPLDASTKLITLQLPPELLPTDVDPSSAVHSVYIKDSDIQVERPYTPLYGIPLEGEEKGRISLWIKKYDHGEVGRWLHSRKIGDVIETRGPVTTWDYVKDIEQNKWDHIVMISGGTGITPFFQFLYHRFSQPVSSTSSPSLSIPQLTLLHGSPSFSTLPPPSIMSTLEGYASAHPQTFSMKVFLEHQDPEEPSPSQAPSSGSVVIPRRIGRIGRADVEDTLVDLGVIERRASTSSWNPVSWVSWLTPWSSRTHNPAAPLAQAAPADRGKKVLFLVCGPERMIEVLAGPRPKSRADLLRTGIIGELGFGAENIRRL